MHRITIALTIAAVAVAGCGADDGSEPTTTSGGVVVDEPTTTGPDRTDRQPSQPPERVPGDVVTPPVMPVLLC